jgi:penicillin-insensitive murein endopeptidase
MPATVASSAPPETPDDEPAAGEDDEAPYENGGIDDGEPDAPRDDTAAHGPPPAAPLDPRLALTDDELRRRVKADLASLGSLSLGTPAAGGLVNPIQLRSSPRLTVVDAAASWGTEETVAYLERAVAKVYERYPSTPPLQVGHLSSRRGGPLSPHRSHQSGRDVDLGYYYRDDKGLWYRRATAANLDVERTWELVRALVTETDAEYIFINTSVQKLLREHALRIGEDATWVDGLFQVGSRSANAIVRHVHGHDTHMHVRFYNPIAADLGRRTLPYLPDRRQVERREEEGLVPYRIHKGETLAVLAKKFGTTVAAIQKANRLRNLKVVAGRTYLVPQKVVVERTKRMQAAPRITVPARRRPPRPPATG